MPENEGGIRVQKVLAIRGEISRRKADALVQAGKVRLPGGRLIKPGDKIDPKLILWVDGRPLERLGIENSTLPSINPRESSVRSSPRRTTQRLQKAFLSRPPIFFRRKAGCDSGRAPIGDQRRRVRQPRIPPALRHTQGIPCQGSR